MATMVVHHHHDSGRKYIVMDDLHLAIKVTLTTGSKERIAVFDFLVAKKGVATLASIANALTMSKTTALRYMTELSAVGLTEIEDVTISGNPTQEIILLREFSWLYSDEFLKLKGDYSPIDRSKYSVREEHSTGDDDSKTKLFWEKFEELESEAESKEVKLTRLQEFILNGSHDFFDGKIATEIFVKKMISSGKITPALGQEGYYVRAEAEGGRV